jgi:hypothetical protein
MPSPAEIEVEECAAPNASYSLSTRRVKPESPPPWRRVRMRSAPGDDLVRIGLVPHVPDETVPRRIEKIVQGYGELDDAEARTEMPTGDGYRINRFLPQFGRELREVRLRQFAQVVGRHDLVEQRRP